MTANATELPAIFIVSHNAEEYRDLVREHLGGDIAFGLAQSAADALNRYNGEPVLLGRPDFLAPLLESGAPVKWVQSTWAGITPLLKLSRRDFQLTGVKGVFGPLMAEYVLAYLLAHEIGIARRQTAQQNRVWDNSYSGTLNGKVIGFMGTGSIGCHVARVAMEFGMEPIGFNSQARPVEPFTRVFSAATKFEFLNQSDYVIGILPDTPATTGLLDKAAFAAMKSDALLINVGRGNLIDEPALADALREGRLGGAVLDVFRTEPLPADSPLWDAPRLQITGHVAAFSPPRDVAALFADNYRRFASGQEPLYVVDRDKGY